MKTRITRKRKGYDEARHFWKKTMGRFSTKLNGGKIRLFSNCFSRVITKSSHVFTNSVTTNLKNNFPKFSLSFLRTTRSPENIAILLKYPTFNNIGKTNPKLEFL